MLIHRRTLLRGLFAMPAVVAASSLMPIRGLILPIRPEIWSVPKRVVPTVTVYNPERELLQDYMNGRDFTDQWHELLKNYFVDARL